MITDADKYGFERVINLKSILNASRSLSVRNTPVDASLRALTTLSPENMAGIQQSQTISYYNDCTYAYGQNGSFGCESNDRFTSHQLVTLIFGILFTLTFIVGLFTNAIVIIVFVFKSELRQFTNYFFANLSISDILVLIVCMPIAITDLFKPDSWFFGKFYCKSSH